MKTREAVGKPPAGMERQRNGAVPRRKERNPIKQVVVQMRVTDRALMRAEQPALQKRHDPMDTRQQIGGGLVAALKKRDPMSVAVRPSQPGQVRPTRLLGCEAGLEFGQS